MVNVRLSEKVGPAFFFVSPRYLDVFNYCEMEDFTCDVSPMHTGSKTLRSK